MNQDPHSLALINAANGLEIEVKDLSQVWKRDAIQLNFQGHTELVLEGRIYSQLSFHNAEIADDKHICKLIFKEMGLCSPEAYSFDKTNEDNLSQSLAGFMEAGQVYVAKPLYGTDGHAVGMNMRDSTDVEMHLEYFVEDYDNWLVEKQVSGQDLRIQVIGAKVVAACIRKPAYVTGNGSESLEELISAHNAKIQEQNPSNFLEIDADTRKLMQKQELYLSSVPESGREVQLKYVSNMGQGGVAVDVTDALHPAYDQLIGRLASRLGLRTFAFDGIVSDPAQDPSDGLYVLEINAKAQWLHHTFSKGKTHNIPELILRELFPELPSS